MSWPALRTVPVARVAVTAEAAAARSTRAPVVLLVYSTLCDHAGLQARTGEHSTWISVETLAAETGTSPRTVKRALAVLADIGLVSTVRRRNTTTVRTIVLAGPVGAQAAAGLAGVVLSPASPYGLAEDEDHSPEACGQRPVETVDNPPGRALEGPPMAPPEGPPMAPESVSESVVSSPLPEWRSPTGPGLAAARARLGPRPPELVAWSLVGLSGARR